MSLGVLRSVLKQCSRLQILKDIMEQLFQQNRLILSNDSVNFDVSSHSWTVYWNESWC